jgi:hypothetical protein
MKLKYLILLIGACESFNVLLSQNRNSLSNYNYRIPLNQHGV